MERFDAEEARDGAGEPAADEDQDLLLTLSPGRDCAPARAPTSRRSAIDTLVRDANDFDWVAAQRGWEAFCRLQGKSAPTGARAAAAALCLALRRGGTGRRRRLGALTAALRILRAPGCRRLTDLGLVLCGRCWHREFWRPSRDEIERIAREEGLEEVDP